MKFFRRPWAMGLLVIALTVLAWTPVFFHGSIPIDGNTLREFYPTWCFARAWNSAWGAPLWNPFRNMGEPYLADPQTMALYPPFWLLKQLPTFTAFIGGWILFHSLVAAFGMIRLLKRWYPTLPDVWFAGAVLIMLNAFFTSRLTLLDHFAAAAYLPWILNAFLENSPATLGLALALQWLAGFPPFSLLSVLMIGILSLRSPRRIRTFVYGGVWALGLAAAQWIPFIELLKHSSRPLILPTAVAMNFSESWRQLAKMLFVPQWYGFFPQLKGDTAVLSFYIGPIALVTAIWGVWKGSRREYWIATGTGIGILLSAGNALPGYAHLTFLHIFRFPANWLLISAFGLSLLCCCGLARIQRPALRKWIIVGIAMDLLIFAHYVRLPWFHESFLSARTALADRYQSAAAPYRLYHTPILSEMYQNQPLDTVDDYQFAKNLLVPSLGMAFGVREVASYQVLTLTRAQRFQERLYAEGPRSPLLRWTGISTVVTVEQGARSVTPETIRIIAPPDPCRPLFLFDPSKGKLTTAWDNPHFAQATVELTSAQRLVYSEIAYPGWSVRVDGRLAPLEVFEDTFLSVLVPAGNHDVEFQFNSLSFNIGAFLSLASLLGFVITLYRHEKTLQ